MKCPNCEGRDITSQLVRDRFEYGTSAHPVTLFADVEMFTCRDCEQKWTGEHGERAREDVVNRYLLRIYPQVMAALIEQHRAIDTLFALLIAKTLHAEEPFYPSKSGQPWDAIRLGKAAIEAAGGRV